MSSSRLTSVLLSFSFLFPPPSIDSPADGEGPKAGGEERRGWHTEDTKYRLKVTRYGLCQVEYLGHTYNRQLQRGAIEYYRCCQHKLGCKARFSITNGLLKAGSTLLHNHGAGGGGVSTKIKKGRK